MIDFIRSWVFNIVTLVIFIVLIEILIPSGKTKKFISLVSGFILLIALLNPLLGLFDKGVDLKEIEISNSNLIDRKSIETDSKVLKDSQMKQISEVYRKKLIKQLEDSTKGINGISDVQADVIINEDYNSVSFGEIKRAYLRISLGEETEDIKPVAKVNKIKIDRGDSTQKNIEDNSEKIDREIKEQVESKVKDLFELSKENIVITLQEKI